MTPLSPLSEEEQIDALLYRLSGPVRAYLALQRIRDHHKAQPDLATRAMVLDDLKQTHAWLLNELRWAGIMIDGEEGAR